MIKAVIFDYSTLLSDFDDTTLQQVQRLLNTFKKLGLKIAVFSTHKYNVGKKKFEDKGLPLPDLVVTKSQVEKNKGSPAWITFAGHELGVANYEVLYVGDDKFDWRTAINAGTLHLHAGWSQPTPREITAYTADTPFDVYLFASHFLLIPPRWAYSLDDSLHGLSVRALLNAGNTTLPATSQATFNLKDVFTLGRNVKVGGYDAKSLLMLHVITSLYLEGLITPNAWFATYPGHEPNNADEKMAPYLVNAAKLFHGYFKEDLLVRWQEAADTSKARSAGKRINIGEQMNSVYINPSYQEKLAGRTVIVLDDFTTTGMSLEWARNLLYEAGAEVVIGVTVGKFTQKHIHELYVPSDSGVHVITPFEQATYSHDLTFETSYEMVMEHNPKAAEIVKASLGAFMEDKPYPITK